MLTDTQKKLVEKAIDLGYSYRKFALNVKLQDWCSPKQQVALENMVVLGEARRYYWFKSSGSAKKYGYNTNPIMMNIQRNTMQ